MYCAGFECLSEDVADVMGLFSEVILQPALPQSKLDLFKSQVRGCQMSWCSAQCSHWPCMGTCHENSSKRLHGYRRGWVCIHSGMCGVDRYMPGS